MVQPGCVFPAGPPILRGTNVQISWNATPGRAVAGELVSALVSVTEEGSRSIDGGRRCTLRVRVGRVALRQEVLSVF